MGTPLVTAEEHWKVAQLVAIMQLLKCSPAENWDGTLIERDAGIIPLAPENKEEKCHYQIRSDQSLSHVRLFATPWTAARQASLSFTISLSWLKLMSIELMMLSNHPIFLLPPSPHALSVSQHQGLFQWVGSSYQVAKVLTLLLQHQSFQWIFKVGFL